MKITVQGSFGILMQNFFNRKVFFYLAWSVAIKAALSLVDEYDECIR